MTANATLVQISVGLPQSYGHEDAQDPMDKLWTSAFFKSKVEGPVHVSQTLVEGDGQANLKNHGGIDKAILLYAEEHYAYWCNELETEIDTKLFNYGAFGENFTILGLNEHSVCIGDEYQIGEIIIQVSQPRHPCWKLARRWRIPDFEKRALASGKLGWYARILQTGTVESGQEVKLTHRPHTDWSIERLNHYLYQEKDNVAANQFIAGCEVLSESWKEPFLARVASNEAV